MKQGETRASMDEELEEDNSETQTRVSRSMKAKLLVRSHAMREEQSPPRPPSPRNNTPHHVKLSSLSQPSPVSPSNPVVVLSPSISRGNSPSRSPSSVKLNVSPNKKCSPRCLSPLEDDLHQRMRNVNLDRDTEPPRNETSSHNENRRRYRNDSNQDSMDSSKEKSSVSTSGSSNILNIFRTNSKTKLRHQGSSQGSFDDSGEQYKDTTGTDLNVFIPETLNRNPKDRAFMLRIEKELVSLARDEKKEYLKFPPMSSYQRMLVHRCAAYFGMDHNIEASGKCVVVNRTRNTRIPEHPFRSHIKDDIIFSEEPRRSILKRESNSSDDYNFKSPDRGYGMENRRSKSFEEREEEYEKVRKRIFKGQRKDINSLDDILHWSEVAPWSSTDSETSTRYKLQLPDSHSRRQGKLLKVHSEEVSETMRPHVSKSYSFGGYGGSLSRGDSVISGHGSGPRLLTKQDSAASSVSWRLSPSSSGYKSQSQMSESVTPSPTSTPHMLRESKRQDSMNSEYSNDKHDNPIVWAVTDMESVPKGSLIINPQTGQPIKNPDGSLYHYDPNNIPSVIVPRAKSPVSPRKSPPTSPRRLTKLSPVSSPKKKSSKCSPIRRFNTTNSATSPTLPYTPPVNMNKSFSFPPLQAETTPQNLAYPPFNISLPPPPMVGDPALSLYNQPYFIPGPNYGVPVPPMFDGRIPVDTSQMVETNCNCYMGSMDNPLQLGGQMVFTQQPTFWPNGSNYFQNQGGNQPRYPPLSQSAPGISPGFVSSQTNANNEMVYSNQPQMQYAYTASQPTTAMYSNQNPIMFNHNSFPTSQYAPQTTTPTAPCSISSQSMSVEPPQQVLLFNDQQRPTSRTNKCMSYDEDNNVGNQAGGHGSRSSNIRGFLLNSSQNSTATSSPATSVQTNFNSQNQRLCRQFSENSSFMPNNFMMMRPIAVRCSTPGTTRSSRSPTPANDMSHFGAQRVAIPQSVIPGMPGMIQHDPSLATLSQQPVLRFFSPLYQQETLRPRKPTKNFRPTGLPPSGR
ncbi:cAMP-regulated phosphoprotein 21 isoform X1 [Harmonia axyridis]|uniref:cAMP-regulated phosphoprotein 21 isoform X1 n=1 Tax=Harmonia axyridis TaxID=115357 RepID=UPI001E276058|nr:cAMP-regulated phosphoprotein 21 isoform X1 [Harmonia axyridis]XP_045481661.1 cAMP-regulated phosphoprotein 21 isoform X1 [Harmonia axyridis]XP_045481663.1 cAMP-regulated phosphoprotein 21 isoform X1 [Harmonia axyridis]XP_045481664.1 cAMP-regulated phosphoprotein 21 isoform X1 [Harmonia axyridis]